jgi:hypothetical protein
MRTFDSYDSMLQVRRVAIPFSGDADYLANQVVPDHLFQIPDAPGGRASTALVFCVVLVDVNGATVAPAGTFTHHILSVVSSVRQDGVVANHVVQSGSIAASQAFNSILQFNPRRGKPQHYAIRLTAFAGLPASATEAVVLAGGI